MLYTDCLKAGTLFKKGSGGGCFLSRRNWKPRYFCLTSHSLACYEHQDGRQKGHVDFSTCVESDLETMPLDCMKTGRSAATNWRLAIKTPKRRLVIATATEKEMNEWAAAIYSVLRDNELRAAKLKSCIVLRAMSHRQDVQLR
ncbi:hypothetical protein AeNC1_017195 [Aphanomyces euteiches]|nr:hypothetical protein AeNC1_017195 [Aphanomyces euteiches]